MTATSSGRPASRVTRRSVDVVEVDVEGWREICSNLSLMHMGRHADADPWFFAAAFAAGRHARAVLG